MFGHSVHRFECVKEVLHRLSNKGADLQRKTLRFLSKLTPNGDSFEDISAMYQQNLDFIDAK